MFSAKISKVPVIFIIMTLGESCSCTYFDAIFTFHKQQDNSVIFFFEHDVSLEDIILKTDRLAVLRVTYVSCGMYE